MLISVSSQSIGIFRVNQSELRVNQSGFRVSQSGLDELKGSVNQGQSLVEFEFNSAEKYLNNGAEKYLNPSVGVV